jgi:hypothetical protein
MLFIDCTSGDISFLTSIPYFYYFILPHKNHIHKGNQYLRYFLVSSTIPFHTQHENHMTQAHCTSPDKTHYFILELFNVPEHTCDSHLTIQHDKMASWTVGAIKAENNSFTAHIRVMMHNKMSPEELEGNTSVSANNHDVMGTDLYIHTKASYETRLISLVENHEPSNPQIHHEIIWLVDLLDYQMESLDTLILLNRECPLYTDDMVSTYWNYIERLYDEEDDELNHDVNSDIGVMENATLPNEKLFLAYHGKGSPFAAEYRKAKESINSHYPLKTA